MKNVETSILPEFTEKLDILGKRHKVRSSGSILYCDENNSKVIFQGIKVQSLNQTANLKGTTGLNVFVVDEAEEFVSEKDFNTIARSVRQKGVPNIVVVVMNPQDAEHWVYKRWIEKTHKMVSLDGCQIPISTHPSVTHIHTTWIDNLENLEQSFIDDAMQTRKDNRAEYDHQFLGKWQDRKEGVIYPNWEEGEFDTSLPFGYGLDFGFWPDPLALVKVAVDKGRKRIYLHEEIYATELSHDMVKSRILQAVQRDKMIIADTSEPRMIEGLQGAGLNVQKADKYPGSVENGIKTLNDYKLIVTAGSYNLKHELRNYTWNDKKSSTPVDKYNHGLDSSRYAAMRLIDGSDFLASNY